MSLHHQLQAHLVKCKLQYPVPQLYYLFTASVWPSVRVWMMTTALKIHTNNHKSTIPTTSTDALVQCRIRTMSYSCFCLPLYQKLQERWFPDYGNFQCPGTTELLWAEITGNDHNERFSFTTAENETSLNTAPGILCENGYQHQLVFSTHLTTLSPKKLVAVAFSVASCL